MSQEPSWYNSSWTPKAWFPPQFNEMRKNKIKTKLLPVAKYSESSQNEKEWVCYPRPPPPTPKAWILSTNTSTVSSFWEVTLYLKPCLKKQVSKTERESCRFNSWNPSSNCVQSTFWENSSQILRRPNASSDQISLNAFKHKYLWKYLTLRGHRDKSAETPDMCDSKTASSPLNTHTHFRHQD